MDIYLMQHGVAFPAAQDPARPLTAAGREAVEQVAGRARELGVRIDRCYHSDRRRAVQTAEILAPAVGAVREERPGLQPSDPVGPLAHLLAAMAQRDPDSAIGLVGHLPFLDHLASLLVARDEHAQVVRFQNAALVKLVPKAGPPGWSVVWVLAPDALR